MNSDLIGVSDAAAILQVGETYVLRAVREGRLAHQAKLPGPRGSWVLSRAEVEAYRQSLTVQPAIAQGDDRASVIGSDRPDLTV